MYDMHVLNIVSLGLDIIINDDQETVRRHATLKTDYM